MFRSLSLVLATFGALIQAKENAPNVIVITLDDVGYTDVGEFGAEWKTSNLDSFISNSVTMSHHYSGYADSASRSQLMTGVHSWHTGYGKQGASFGTSTIGGIPLGVPTMAEYLKDFGKYNTYYIGSWDLGHSVLSHTPNNRGFDYFYGSYSGATDVLTRTQTVTPSNNDPSTIVNDENGYYDFWENDELLLNDKLNNIDSNKQYTRKAVQIIEDRKNENSKSGSFLLFVSFQSVSTYYNSGMQFDDEIVTRCASLVSEASNNYIQRRYTCQYMLDLDKQIGEIFGSLQDIWDNSVILLTSDNGGTLSMGSCNYPMRGGKYSFYDGNVRTIGVVGGGLVPDAKRGEKLRGLMSNVDWVPTILGFTSLIPSDWTKVLNIDGYNMYSYITSLSDETIATHPSRDHILLDLEMFGTEIYTKETSSHLRQWAWTENDINNHRLISLTMTGLAMIFYDDNGMLYKYFVSNKDDEVADDDVNLDYNWCIREKKISGKSKNKLTFTDYEVGTLRPFSGLFDLSTDMSEQNNLLTSITSDDFDTLKTIIQEKADYYISSDYSERSKYVYDAFDCFYNNFNVLAYPGKTSGGAWSQFIDDDDFEAMLQQHCGFTTDHPLYTLHTEATELDMFVDNSAKATTMNTRMPEVHTAQQTTTRSVVTIDTIESLLDKSKIENLQDRNNVYSSCSGLHDGRYYIQIDLNDDNPIVTAQCSNGYMLIDYSSDNNWKNYFSSWIQFHWQVASPFKSDYADFTKWFVPDSESGDYNYLLSYDCDVCDEDSLLQTEGTSTTYWQSTVPNFCGSADKGVNAADEMWNYQCRNAVFSAGYGGAELIDIWHMTDENGIDRDLLLTKLSTTDAHLGICSSLKKAADYDNFKTQASCAKGQNGEMPVLGMEGKFCICAKKSDTTEMASQKLITDDMRRAIRSESRISKPAQDDKGDSKNKVYYLYASDFTSGTYRIRESGTYMIMEDIVFDYNAPDYESNPDYSANSFDETTGDMHWYPKQTQKSDYPGAYQWRDEYHLGFFAGITIEVDDVTLDLNGHTLEMDERYFFQQPFWSHIQFGSSNFIPGKGPSPLGADPQFVSNIIVKNGILGLTSHHCLHGTSPKHSEMQNLVIENIVCKDFTTHGIQLNGFNGVKILNVEVGPTNSKHLLTSDYSNMRTLLPRFRYFSDLYSDTTYKFGGKPSTEYMKKNNIDPAQVSLNNEDEYTLNDLLDMAIEQMDMAFDFVTGRKTEESLYNEYGLEWLQAKRVFVYDEQDGIPYGGSMYGVYLNYPGTGITGFYTNNEVSKNVEIDGLYIHDLVHGTLETVCITDHSKSIFGVAVSASKLLGDENFNNWNNIHSIQSNGEMYYYGTIVYDIFLAFYDIVSQDANNVDALNMGVFEDNTLTWAKTGDYQTNQNWLLTCGNDPMFHAVKGLYGLRISGVEGARVSNLKIENMVEVADLGTDACGSFVVFSQQQPYMYGWSGNNVHSISVLHSDVLFDNIEIDNIESYTGNSTAMSVYPRSNVKFEGESNSISNIIAGSQFQDESYSFDTLLDAYGGSQYPNPMPRACAVLKDDFGTSAAVVSIDSLNDYDNTQMSVSCMSGYLDCDQNEVSSKATWSNFGSFGGNGDNCLYNSLVDETTETTSFLSKLGYFLNPKSYSLFTVITISAMILVSCLVCYYNQNVISKISAELQGYRKI